MAVMVRKQMYLEPRQDVQIKQQQRAQEAWEEALAFAEAWAAQEPVSGGRTWAREELYEERLNRYGQALPEVGP